MQESTRNRAECGNEVQSFLCVVSKVERKGRE